MIGQREHPTLERQAKLQFPYPVSLMWHEGTGDDLTFWCVATCDVCQKSERSWVTLGVPDCAEEEEDSLYELEYVGCSHTEAAHIVLQLLRLESP